MLDKFLSDTLFRGTTGRVYVCSLPTTGEGGREKHVVTRNLDRIRDFVREHDRPGLSTYFCVTTLRRSQRRKENALEAVFVFADIDLKDLDMTLEEVLEQLKLLSLPPSRVHSSGHGLHLYWYLDEETGEMDRIEALEAKIGKIVAGDPRARHAVTLLRVPGSHNSKNGEWRAVETLEDVAERRYSLDALEAWEQEPLIRTKSQAPEEEEDNPFLRHAREHGFRLPVDVDKRLADMTYKGEGDSAIHLTQLSVTASLMSAGWDEDDVVKRILDRVVEVINATGEVWNWIAEEATIRKMCADWVRKQEGVVDLAERRRQRAEGKKTPEPEEEKGKKKRNKAKGLHVMLGRGILDDLVLQDKRVLTRRREVWKCENNIWELMDPADLQAWIDIEIEKGSRTLNMTSTNSLVTETRKWILRNPDINDNDVKWDDHRKIALRNVLLDPKTMKTEPLVWSHYATSSAKVDYDPKASCPHWFKMMDEIFDGDDQPVKVLQDMIGMSLISYKMRGLMKALILIGGSNSGKSGILNVITGLHTTDPNTTPLDQLENPHGKMAFLRNTPWVLHEAFNQGKWHFSSEVKALLTGDPINVNIKNGPIVSHVFRSPVFWGTNNPPQFKEQTRAIQNRIMIISCPKIFDPENLVGEAAWAKEQGYASPADYVLEKERSGILNWALEGMNRSVTRGFIEPTEEMRMTLQEVGDNANMAIGFFKDAVDFDSDSMVTRQDLHAAFSSWWAEDHGGEIPGPAQFGNAIKNMYELRVATDKNLARDDVGNRYYVGIKLSATGLSFWSAGSSGNLQKKEYSGARYSSTDKDVNQVIPDKWGDRLFVQKMRLAHAKKRPKP